MSLSNSQVLRRYTPPTCTLEIVASSSPLSRWAGRTVATQLRFHLHLDDPRQPEQRIHLSGDREQLEGLQQAVTSYVQQILHQSPTEFTTHLAQTTSTNSTTVAEPQQVVVSSTDAVGSSPSNLRRISLKPSNGLSHTLFLGSLATPVTGPMVHLSILQLFDLVSAIDEYEADIVALPSLHRRSRVSSTPPAWATIAAGLTLAVGLFAVLQQLNRPVQQQTATNNQLPEDQQLAAEPSPLPPLSSLDTLPPPPPEGASVPVPTTPPPAVPVPATPPTDSTTTLPPTSVPGATAPQAGSSDAPTVAVPSPPIAQLNIPNPGSQAAISRTQPTTPAQPASPPPAPQQQQAANSTTAAVRSPSPPPAPSEPAALDNISQVAEARQFFQQRWEPTEVVRQTLEYSLLLDVDGTIQRIEPLNQAARDQIDRTGMPLIGEPFVSPISDGQVARIRVVLTPEGRVQTFLEDREAPQVTRDPREDAQ